MSGTCEVISGVSRALSQAQGRRVTLRVCDWEAVGGWLGRGDLVYLILF